MTSSATTRLDTQRSIACFSTDLWDHAAILGYNDVVAHKGLKGLERFGLQLPFAAHIGGNADALKICVTGVGGRGKLVQSGQEPMLKKQAVSTACIQPHDGGQIVGKGLGQRNVAIVGQLGDGLGIHSGGE